MDLSPASFTRNKVEEILLKRLYFAVPLPKTIDLMSSIFSLYFPKWEFLITLRVGPLGFERLSFTLVYCLDFHPSTNRDVYLVGGGCGGGLRIFHLSNYFSCVFDFFYLKYFLNVFSY